MFHVHFKRHPHVDVTRSDDTTTVCQTVKQQVPEKQLFHGSFPSHNQRLKAE